MTDKQRSETPMDLEHERRLADVEARSKHKTLRIDKLEKSTEAISRLATSMEVMATKQDEVASTVDKLDKKVTIIESKPAKRWESIVDKIILTIAAAIIGFFLSRIGL